MIDFRVNEEQALSFLSSIGLQKIDCSSSGLQKLIRSSLSIVPFTNIMMLARPRKPPTQEEIIDDMLSLRGGPCGHYNPFMNEILRYCGFDSSLIPAWIKGQLSHMAIIIKIEGENWWVDFGNGHPYLTPIRLSSEEIIKHAGMEYRITNNSNGTYSLEHRTTGKEDFMENYIFTTKRVPFSFFEEMVRLHYTNPGFGPFLEGIRFIRFPDCEMIAVRDKTILITSDGTIMKSRITENGGMEEVIKTHFSQAKYPLRDGLEVLGWC
jgi:arylamine N-acetyltransferase